jgi:hypothetical protein
MTSMPATRMAAKQVRVVAAAAVLALVAAVFVQACGDRSRAPAAPSDPGSGGTPPGLSETLQSGCFGWPGIDFSPGNKANVATFLGPGQRAVDFALRNTAGAVVRLSELLATRPVLLIAGSFT